MNDNKIAPFCINIVGMRRAEIAELVEISVEAGADFYEDVDYWQNTDYNYFGVDHTNDTMFYDDVSSYGLRTGVGVLSTITDVYTHLGITKDDTEGEAPESQNKGIKEEANTVAPIPCLKGVKIDLRGAEGNVDSVLSAKFQLACFEQGIYWQEIGDGTVKHLDRPFLYVGEGGISQDYGGAFFQEHPNKEIIFTPDNIQFTIADVTPPKETININGVNYYKEDVDKMLSGITPVGGE